MGSGGFLSCSASTCAPPCRCHHLVKRREEEKIITRHFLVVDSKHSPAECELRLRTDVMAAAVVEEMRQRELAIR
jgi:hypothetical protein